MRFFSNITSWIVVDTTAPVSDIELSLSGVMSSRRISKTPTVEEISEHKAVENTLKRVNTIDGSYHHLEVIWDQAYTYCCLVAVHGAFLRMNTKPSAVLASHQI